METGANMKFLVLILSTVIFTFAAQAEVITSSKDWSAEKNVVTPLEKPGCIAETTKEIDVNGTLERWTLQIVKLETGNGDYTMPITIAFPEDMPTNAYYEASAQSNKTQFGAFQMTLLQPQSGDKTIVANKVMDRNKIVDRIAGDSTFTVDFLSKNGPTRSVEFSLRGSSKTIKTMLATCL